MGLDGVSVTQLLIVFLIALAIFGSKHLKTLGGDLGTALRGFRNAMNAPEEPPLRVEDTPERPRLAQSQPGDPTGGAQRRDS